MKHRQERIYSALIDLDIWIPKVRRVSVPSRPETTVELSIVSPDSQAPGVAALRVAEVRGAQAEASLPRLRAAAAAMRLSRASHDFGEVSVGDEEYWLLALHNEEEKEGIINDIIGLPSEGFSLFEPPTLPFTLPPHGSRIIIVRYAPDLAGNKSVASLSITTNDPYFPVQKVLLTGTGVTAPQHEVRCNSGKGTDSWYRRRGR